MGNIFNNSQEPPYSVVEVSDDDTDDETVTCLNDHLSEVDILHDRQKILRIRDNLPKPSVQVVEVSDSEDNDDDGDDDDGDDDVSGEEEEKEEEEKEEEDDDNDDDNDVDDVNEDDVDDLRDVLTPEIDTFGDDLKILQADRHQSQGVHFATEFNGALGDDNVAPISNLTNAPVNKYSIDRPRFTKAINGCTSSSSEISSFPSSVHTVINITQNFPLSKANVSPDYHITPGSSKLDRPKSNAAKSHSSNSLKSNSFISSLKFNISHSIPSLLQTSCETIPSSSNSFISSSKSNISHSKPSLLQESCETISSSSKALKQSKRGSSGQGLSSPSKRQKKSATTAYYFEHENEESESDVEIKGSDGEIIDRPSEPHYQVFRVSESDHDDCIEIDDDNDQLSRKSNPINGDYFNTPPQDLHNLDIRVHYRLPSLSPTGTSKCNRKKCKLCQYTFEADSIQFPGGVMEVSEHFTCLSRGVVYVIKCKRCNKCYIGQTGNTLTQRAGQHIASIKKNHNGSVPAHFNASDHERLKDFSISAVRSCVEDEERRDLENSLIFEYKCLWPKGMNLIVSLQ